MLRRMKPADDEAPENSSGKLMEVAPHERPQERLEKYGPRALRDAELIAMLLRVGTTGENVLTVSEGLVRRAGSLKNLIAWTPEEFSKTRGLGRVKALQLTTVFEISRRILADESEAPVLDGPDRVAEFLAPDAFALEVEKCWVLCLNVKNRLLRREEVTSGTATASLLHPREVFRPALRHGAAAVIVAHNHPSGDPAPSKADLDMTRRLADAAKILGVTLSDHVILGRREADPTGRGRFSFAEAGLL
jgi:DNA repair protein RadC